MMGSSAAELFIFLCLGIQSLLGSSRKSGSPFHMGRIFYYWWHRLPSEIWASLWEQWSSSTQKASLSIMGISSNWRSAGPYDLIGRATNIIAWICCKTCSSSAPHSEETFQVTINSLEPSSQVWYVQPSEYKEVHKCWALFFESDARCNNLFFLENGI